MKIKPSVKRKASKVIADLERSISKLEASLKTCPPGGIVHRTLVQRITNERNRLVSAKLSLRQNA